jgi:SAM-dependent methyltransferase
MLDSHAMNCVACASDSLRKLHRYRAQTENERRVFSGHLYACEACQAIQLYPMPTEAQLSEFYRSEYRSVEFAERWAETSRQELATSKTGTSGLVELLHPFQPRRILEVGAGTGHHSRAARHAFSDAEIWCAEPDEIFQDILKREGFSVIPHGWPEAATHLLGRFDAVILSHVLEHVLNPPCFLQSLVDVTAPRGVIAIEVPNDPEWRVYAEDHSPHVTFFTPASLKTLLSKFGKVEFIDTAGHFGRPHRPRWKEAALQAIPRPIRVLRSKLKNQGKSDGPAINTAWVDAEHDYGGEERWAIRAILRV